jgi:hypothetical protein
LKVARKRGTYKKEIRKAEDKKIGIVVEVVDNDNGSGTLV